MTSPPTAPARALIVDDQAPFRLAAEQVVEATDGFEMVPGVFAAGDVRHGSVKRVASAVGEGAIAIQLVHEYLRRDRSYGPAGRRQ